MRMWMLRGLSLSLSLSVSLSRTCSSSMRSHVAPDPLPAAPTRAEERARGDFNRASSTAKEKKSEKRSLSLRRSVSLLRTVLSLSLFESLCLFLSSHLSPYTLVDEERVLPPLARGVSRL